jgi:hypothetical protein
MTDSVYFEADSDRCLELNTLAAKLASTEEDLLKEAMEMLLQTYRDREAGNEPIGVLAGLHGVQHRIRIIVKELKTIRFMTSSADSMLQEMGIAREACDSLSRHYRSLFDSSERALKAAGFGPAFQPLPLEYDDETGGTI